MSIENMTFGIEIESHIPQGTGIVVGSHGAGRLITSLANGMTLEGWKADGDPSIRAPQGRVPCEFISPVLRGTEGLKKLIADLATIRAVGAQVNDSCGLHIHVGFQKSNAKALARMVTIVSNFETAIYASTGTRKRMDGQWCRGVRQHGTACRALNTGGRYYVLNTQTRAMTVEFRAFSGSTNTTKIIAYLRMVLGMVEKCMAVTKAPSWRAKQPVVTNPLGRMRPGKSAICRLMYWLGWTKGRSAQVYGHLTCEGAPDLQASKKELVRLADKFDDCFPEVRAPEAPRPNGGTVVRYQSSGSQPNAQNVSRTLGDRLLEALSHEMIREVSTTTDEHGNTVIR